MLVPILSWGHSKFSPHTAHFLNAYRQATIDNDTSELSRYQLKRLPAQETEISIFIHVADESALAEAEEVGARIGTVAGNMATARVSLSELQALASLDNISYIEIGTSVAPQMNEAKPMANIHQVLKGTDLEHPYTGKDVVVGIIDTGIEYGHLHFWNSDRTELRVKRVWNQYATSEASPEPYGYGAEYTTQEEILAAAYDTNTETHGTHTTGIAAGSYIADDGTDYRGAAPEADIVIVSLNYDDMLAGNNATVLDGINYIFDYAESVGKPCVINMSLGSHLGPHDGSSTFDMMCDELQGPGRLLVGSAGNEAEYAMHAAKTIDPAKNDTLKTFFNFAYDVYQQSELEIWGSEKDMELHFIPIVYNINENRVETMMEPIIVSPEEANEWEYYFTVEKENIAGNFAIISEMNPNNGKPHFAVATRMIHSDTHRLGFFITSPDAGNVHIWTDMLYSTLSDFGVEGYISSDNSCTVGEIGGTGKRLISVGAYISRDYYESYGIHYPGNRGELKDLAIFSSLGPTADGRMKPEIAAPGSYIISSMSSYYTTSAPRISPVKWNDVKYYFGYMAGTSMSSPLVAGVLATWMQAFPQLTPEIAKDIMKRTAITDSFTGTGSSNKWGYGKIDAFGGLKASIQAASGIEETANDDNTVVITQAGRQLSLLFTRASSSVQATIYDMNGASLLVRDLNNVLSGDEYTIDLNNQAPGFYLIKVSDNQHTQIKKFIINQ